MRIESTFDSAPAGVGTWERGPGGGVWGPSERALWKYPGIIRNNVMIHDG